MDMKKSKVIIASGLFLLTVVVVGFFVFAKNEVNEISEIKNQAVDILRPQKIEENLENKSATSTETAVSLIAVGDVMLSRTVAKKIKDNKDVNYPFLKMKEYLASADLVFANLETPITPGPVVSSGSMVFHADPGVEKALENNNFSIVSLANNHTPNYGQKGLLDTFKYLQSVDIEYVGAGENEQKANQPIIIEEKGLKIAFLAFNDRDVVPPSYGAGINRAGTALMDVAKMTNAVRQAKLQVDLVIVSMHSGNEYTEVINSSQSTFAHAAIDAGAELVIGHHPHVVQRIEKYQGKYIFYSLGNFVFDQMWSEDTRQGIAVKMFLNKKGMEKAEVTPIMIENYSQPNILSGKKADKVLKRLKVEGDEKIILKN